MPRPTCPPGSPCGLPRARLSILVHRDPEGSGRLFGAVYLSVGARNFGLHQTAALVDREATAYRHAKDWLESPDGEAALRRECEELGVDRGSVLPAP